MPDGVVYILGSKTGTLYTGVTSNLVRRMLQHQEGTGSKFASRYGCHRLLYFELFHHIEQAIAREKALKGKTRAKKIALIRAMNPEFCDLAEKWGWMQIGPAWSIAEVEEELRKRVKLSLPAAAKRKPD